MDRRVNGRVEGERRDEGGGIGVKMIFGMRKRARVVGSRVASSLVVRSSMGYDIRLSRSRRML